MKRNFTMIARLMEITDLTKCIVVLVLVSLLVCSCKNGITENEEKSDSSEDRTEISIEVDAATIYQTIDHFGASDAWSCQFVGNWPNQKKEAIADLLFSQDLDEKGKPKGIGLSLWRFNIGAGSSGQGEESDILDEWRRAESFMESDGSYNWNKQQGQMWFAQAAKDYGVDKLLLFPNSPPVNFTKNEKAYAYNGETNLSPENFDDFAEYLAMVIEGMQSKGLKVDYVSPVNEPQWDWSDAGQEGTPFWNNEIAEIVRALNGKLTEKNLSSTIDIAEAGQINFLYEKGDKPGRSNQIQDFFTETSPNYIGDLAHMGHAISGHSYFTTSPFSEAVDKRMELANNIDQTADLNYWMSEYCILGDNAGEIKGEGRDLGIDPALYVARVIHNDLVVAQASAWHWWLAVSPYDYKDGLVYIDKQKEDGQYFESKMLWAFGNYSRFIRPGYQRIDMKLVDETPSDSSFLFSGYKNPENGGLVFVFVNSGIKEVRTRLEEEKSPIEVARAYITSSESDLSPYELVDGSTVSVPARSIITLVTKNPN